MTPRRKPRFKLILTSYKRISSITYPKESHYYAQESKRMIMCSFVLKFLALRNSIAYKHPRHLALAMIYTTIVLYQTDLCVWITMRIRLKTITKLSPSRSFTLKYENIQALLDSIECKSSVS